MAEIDMPFPLKDVPIKPEMKGRVKLDETMIQSLAALCGYDGEARRLLTCSVSGSLNSISPPIKGFIHAKAADPPVVMVCSGIPTTEVIIRGHPDNTGIVWVDICKDPTPASSWPLAANDSITISTNLLCNIRFLMTVKEESAIVGWTH